ncbi:MAG: SIMPL domain-containing protein [Holosporaceae bacterium]|jgi:hypothetical protein|nr:SIMPL domain-containing protein [Holosporaceae bacterium]
MKSASFLGALVISFGLIGFGYFSSKKIGRVAELVEVKGLSEKVVRADVGDIHIGISNSDTDLEELYKKRVADKAKVMEFLKNHGVIDEEIVNFSMETDEKQEEDKVTSSGVTTTKKQKYYIANDKFTVRSKDLSKIKNIKEDMVKLLSEGVFINYTYSYRLTSFADVKMEMMKEASENAKKNAEAFIKPQGIAIGKVIYLRQGEITIRGEDETENVESWNSKESTSINKRLRLVVRAGFAKRRSIIP